TNARHAAHRELDRQHLTSLTTWKVRRRPVCPANGAVGKRPGIKARCLFRIALVPQADRVLLHCVAPRLVKKGSRLRGREPPSFGHTFAGWFAGSIEMLSRLGGPTGRSSNPQ